MNKFVITCGSTADFTEERAREREIAVLPFRFRINEENYIDDFGKNISNKEFYDRFSKGANVKTSSVNVGEYVEFFEPYLKDGIDVIHITLSSGLSGSYDYCLSAKKELEEKYPERKIYVIDSLCGSMGYGMLVEDAADLRDQGKSAAETTEIIENKRLNIRALYFTADLTAFIKGGRLSVAAGFIGNILKIVPLLGVTKEGRLEVKKKLIGKRRAVAELVSEMAKDTLNGNDYDGRCIVGNADAEEDAAIVVSEIEKVFPKLKGKCVVSEIGPVMGCHCGKGTIAVFFEGKAR